MRKEKKAVNDVARYEAANWNEKRSYLPGFIQSAREDISSLSRLEILRCTRYFEKNSGVLLKVLRCLDVNVVGTGITPTPSGKNADWGKLALAWWDEWATVADVTEQSDAYKLQSIGYRAQNIDGDAFIELTTSASGRPAIDIIEGHRVGNNGLVVADMEAKGFKVVDGVVIDAKRRPVAYIVADEFSGRNIRLVPASRMVKLFNRKRSGQYRGISILHAAILTLHHLDDLQNYEMDAAKDAASKANIFKTPAGGVNSEEAIGASLNASTATSDPAARAAQYRKTLSGETLVLQPGEEMTQFESKRPSAAMTGFWDKLDEKIVQGAGISYAALIDYRGNWGGATLRAVVQSDNRTYELETIEEAKAWQKVWDYVIGWAIDNRELAPDVEWRKVRWHRPRGATVDVGNDSAAMLNELKAGARTYETIYGESGEDWRERLDQRAKEEAFLQELATKYKIDRTSIASFAQQSLSGTAPGSEEPANSQRKGGEKEQKE
jgi:lambda family phage portal protein